METFALLMVLVAGVFMLIIAWLNPKNITRTLFQRVAFSLLGLGAVIIAVANLAGFV